MQIASRPLHGPRNYVDRTWERSANYSARKALANEGTLLRTHCCRHKCFPVCAAQETSWSTMCPRLPGPLAINVWKPWVTERKWKIQGDVLHEVLPKTLHLHVSHTARLSPPKSSTPTTVSTILANSPTIFRFLFFSKKTNPHSRLQQSSQHCGSIVQRAN